VCRQPNVTVVVITLMLLLNLKGLKILSLIW